MTFRFPREVGIVLAAAGWYQGRRDELYVARATRRLQEQASRFSDRAGGRFHLFPAASAVLAEFGGIAVEQDGPGRQVRRRPFEFDVVQVAATTQTLAGFSEVIGRRVLPIGLEGANDSILAIDEDGRVFALDHAGDWFLGPSIDAALTTLVTGTRPPRLTEAGTW
ncbi:SUKH-3 domain-containing protein [Kribbella sp. NPDC055071]